MRSNVWFLLTSVATALLCRAAPPPLEPVVEAEEVVYSYVGADNGSGPMWCHGNSCVVRLGDAVLVSGLETITGAKPLNNCLPLLYTRGASGWKQVFKGTGRTREPCPLVAFPDGRVFMSINPTLTRPPRMLRLALEIVTSMGSASSSWIAEKSMNRCGADSAASSDSTGSNQYNLATNRGSRAHRSAVAIRRTMVSPSMHRYSGRSKGPVGRSVPVVTPAIPMVA